MTGAAATTNDAPLARPTHLRTENLADPVGIDAPAPRLSWQLAANTSTGQSAYEVRASVVNDADGAAAEL